MNRLKIVEVGKSTIVGIARGGDGPGTVQFPDGTVATISEGPSTTISGPMAATITDGNGTTAPLTEAFEVAIEKADQAKTPFMRACDDLVEVLAEAEQLFVERFRLPGDVPLMDKLVLAYRKRGNHRGLWVINAEGIYTPLLSCNAEWRAEAATRLGDLWEVCLGSDQEALDKVLASTIAVKKFLSNVTGSNREP